MGNFVHKLPFMTTTDPFYFGKSRLQLFLSDANWLNTDKAWTKDPAKGPIDYFKLSLNFVSPLHRRRLCLTLAFDLEDSWGLWCRGAGGVRDKEGRKST
jgi:hypothetical protein